MNAEPHSPYPQVLRPGQKTLLPWETPSHPKPQDLLFVGDTIYTDIQLAEEHGIPSALVLTGNTKRDALSTYIVRPDFVVDSVKDIEDLL